MQRYIRDRLPILCTKLMCHYFSYFSATPVRTFLNAAQWKEINQNYVNGFLIIFLFAANGTFWTQKWDVSLDPLPPPPPLLQSHWWKTQRYLLKNYKQKKWRKLSRNYVPNWKTCWKKALKNLIFLVCGELSCVSASPSIPHNSFTFQLSPSVTYWPTFPQVFSLWNCLSGLKRHTLENSLYQWQPQEEPLKMKGAKTYMKDLLKEAVHEIYIKNFFKKKISFWINGPFQVQIWHTLAILDPP